MATEIRDLDGILAKVRKMLDTTGRTPEEAAAFVEQAHTILAKYDLTIESVAALKADARTAVTQVDAKTAKTEGKPDGWKSDLLLAVARSFECRVIYTTRYEETKSGRSRRVQEGHLIGFGHDVEAAGYAQSFLVGEVTRLAKAYVRPMWDEIKAGAAWHGSVHASEQAFVQETGRHPLKAEVYFVKGAAQTISESLTREARDRAAQAAATNPNALVVQKAAEVDDFIYMKNYGMTKAEYMAKAAERAAAYRAAYPEQPAKIETPAARARREEAEYRRNARDSRTYWNRVARENARMDHGALEAGQRAGRTVSIRPGVSGAPKGNGGHIDG